MPQYLAPDVYVEEVDTGSKPIEGVSTSIAGVVGVTERGPLNVPILVTSNGEFAYWFGGVLAPDEFGQHRFLPHSAEGFFTNGGKQLYVTRVLDTELTAPASAELFDRTAPLPFVNTMLLRAAPESTGTAANPPPLVVMPDANLAVNDWLRIGDGSNAEYRQIAIAPTVENVLVPLHLPLGHSHDDGGVGNAQQIDRVTAGGALTLTLTVGEDAQAVDIDGANADVAALMAGTLVEIGGASGEYRFVTAVSNVAPSSATNQSARLTLDATLAFGYPQTTTKIQPLKVPAVAAPQASIHPAVRAGDSLLYVDSRGVDFDDRTKLVLLDRGLATQEVRRIGELYQLTISSPAETNYDAGSLAQIVKLGDDGSVTIGGVGAAAAAVKITVTDTTPFHASQQILVGPANGPYETETVASVITNSPGPDGTLNLVGTIATTKAASAVVIAQRTLTAPANSGLTFLSVNDRSGLAVGNVLHLVDGANEEFVEISLLPLPGLPGVWPDAGNVVLSSRLLYNFSTATKVIGQNAPAPDAAFQSSTLAVGAATNATTLLISDAKGWVASRFIRVQTLENAYFHRITAIPASPIAPNPAAAVDAAKLVTLTNPALVLSHPVGSAVIQRQPLFDVAALDPGTWGNRLRMAIQDEGSGLVATTQFLSVINSTRARVASIAGMEPGTVLELVQTDGTVLGSQVKVATVNRASGEVTFDAGNALSAAQMGAAPTLKIRSREFRLSVFYYNVADPSAPTRTEPVLPAEVFRNLSMDVRHSHYFQAVIGDIDGTPLRLSDHRPEGSSWFIRVHDPAGDLPEPARSAALQSLRLGPEALVDILPNGSTRAARQQLAGGDDSIATLSDAAYIGADAVDPENRTGLFTLLNIEDISIIAAPGRTSPAVQQALIDQCENNRYRFAVLDGPSPPSDTLSDVQSQRQQFDTKYAALYHPWLLIPNPFPGTPGTTADYAVPPAGHLLGVYARTDIERGVHKAPANEVVMGITGLQRIVNKEQQEILNPYPVNINVIRDFRNQSRGIRVYGGRVITSDSDWKYVNVRRLLIFIEASLNQGLQYVVFEPNAEPLWARVKRSVSNFLTLVWRNGALEGIKPEEAFFVKCDKTTMTETDREEGRLIVLVGVAPVKPAEFVIVRIGLWTASADQ